MGSEKPEKYEVSTWIEDFSGGDVLSIEGSYDTKKEVKTKALELMKTSGSWS